MATLLLQAAGATLGGLFGPVGAMVGRAAGALAGNMIDRSLISGLTTIEATPLSTARIPGADEGTAVNRVYGTVRIGGTLIWATRFEEDVSTERSGSKATGPRVESFSYFANFAIGLCEGPIAGIRRIWADGRELDQHGVEMRFYHGNELQDPDSLIEAKQGDGMAPAYRGLAYVVFERLPLDLFGNRIPVLEFEVIRIVGSLESDIRAITIIPGATEHGYSPERATERTGDDSRRIINRNQMRRWTDWDASIAELKDVCPNLERVALVVSWFGTDLRAGHCRILPGVEVESRDQEDPAWSVAGYSRTTAHLISHHGGGPAYGGTPNDLSVIKAIRDLRDRGLEVYLYPFVMMDIPPGNALVDPYGGSEQAAYPWRGRITCLPAPGQPGTADQTAAAQDQINDFVGHAQASDFVVDGSSIRYTGSDEGYRRMILHYALLAEAAGGVKGFIIGSELRGLTAVRNAGGAFAFVNRLVDLAEDVRAIVGSGAKLTYAADWSEYFGYHPDDGTGDVYFNLDPLWASDAIAAVGIDNYMPLADFRDSDFVSAHPDGAVLADDKAAMRAAITSGEGFDWYYPSGSARKSRDRVPIEDGLAGKHWVYRYKDIEGWWNARHYDRVGGAELGSPTGWTPKMKPVWFTEIGCPAIDRGGNQPNVFVDPKSAESNRPHFSGGMRSDEMQRRFLSAHHDYWSSDAAPSGMVDTGHMFAWTWDARAYPAFPEDEDLYADGANWQTGHWLNGRLGAGTLSTVIARILRDNGITQFDVSAVSGDLKGYVMGRQASARDLLEPLVNAFRLDVRDVNGVMVFRSRGLISAPAETMGVFADLEDEPRWSEMLGQDGDFAGEAIIDFQSEANDYESASMRSRRLSLASDRVLRLALPGVLDEDCAGQAAEALLRDHRLSRRQVNFSLPPTSLTHEPGDVVAFDEGPEGRFLITRIEDGAVRTVEAREVGTGDSAAGHNRRIRRDRGRNPNRDFSPVVQLMDLPRYKSGAALDFACAAVTAKPWRRIALSVSPESENFEQRVVANRPAQIGRLLSTIAPGPLAAFDNATMIDVRMIRGGFQSVSDLAVFNGANRIAVGTVDGGWEIIGFRGAEETATDIWRLSGLLRGLGGTEDAMSAGSVAGGRLVVLDSSVLPLGLKQEEAGLTLNWLAESFGASAGRAGPYVFTGGLRAETPLAPVHLAATRLSSGDIDITWIRRSRMDGDGWDGEDIPLDEAQEGYRLEILSGAAVVRMVETAEPSLTYPAAAELADFGAPQSELLIRVRQRGSRVALGIAAMATVSL